jgi:aspartyl-tRNA(Asn)/glutamyl-tRNA(Gln) amidotransferase subunit A
MGPVALGSDGGGSIRFPASFCGVFGLKPSRGRVPVFPSSSDPAYPGLSSWRTLGHIGPISRTVADATLVLESIAGPDPRDPLSVNSDADPWLESVAGGEVAGRRVVYSADWGYAVVDPAIRRAVDKAVTVLEGVLGAHVTAADPGWDDPGAVMKPLIAADSDLHGMRAMRDASGAFTTPGIAEMLATEWSAEDLTTALFARDRISMTLTEFMADFDLLVTPTVAVLPFPADAYGPMSESGVPIELTDWSPFTFPINLTGQPAATVPVGWTDDGLPIGMQIVKA